MIDFVEKKSSIIEELRLDDENYADFLRFYAPEVEKDFVTTPAE